MQGGGSLAPLALAAAAMAAACGGGGAPGAAAPAAVVQLPAPAVSGASYVLYAPPGAGAAGDDRAWPLIVFLHGYPPGGGVQAASAARDDLYAWAARHRFEGALLAGPVADLEATHHAAQTDAVIRDVSRRYRVDPGRVYLLGYSMGGRCAWPIAAALPGRFAAVAAIAGGIANEGFQGLRRADPAELAPMFAALTGVPAREYHSRLDEVVPFAEGADAVAAYALAGGAAEQVAFQTGSHYPDEVMQALDGGVLDWLLAQSRPDAAEGRAPRPAHRYAGTYTDGSVTAEVAESGDDLVVSMGQPERYAALGGELFGRWLVFRAAPDPDGTVRCLEFPGLGWRLARDGGGGCG